jgi:2-haloacid dehalogenase
MPFRPPRAFVFDAYGTLFDVHSVTAIAEAIAPDQGAVLSQIWRAKQLQYTWLQSLMMDMQARRADFAAVTADALDYAIAQLTIPLGTADRDRLLDGYRQLSPFADAQAALAGLAGYPRWILSNGTHPMLAPLVQRSALAPHIDGILSAEDAGIFKPSPRVYQLAVQRLQLEPADIAFVSANGWDAAGAKAFGFLTFWINRNGEPIERHAPEPDFIVGSLGNIGPIVRNR